MEAETGCGAATLGGAGIFGRAGRCDDELVSWPLGSVAEYVEKDPEVVMLPKVAGFPLVGELILVGGMTVIGVARGEWGDRGE